MANNVSFCDQLPFHVKQAAGYCAGCKNHMVYRLNLSRCDGSSCACPSGVEYQSLHMSYFTTDVSHTFRSCGTRHPRQSCSRFYPSS
jgi:hypothetical protein